MSVTYTIDVWCDHRDCDEWTHGVCVRGANAKERDARLEAKRRGWTRRRVYDLMVDLCPEHSSP